MDSLTSKVQEILGSEEGMKQLGEMAKMLGLAGGEESPPQQAAGPDLGALLSGAAPTGQEAPLISAAELEKLSGILRSARQDTPAAALLRALRPMLRESRQKRVDEALRILRLLSILPVLQQSGLLRGLLGEDSSNP